MKRIYNYILLSVFAFAAAGCLEDDLNPGGQLGNSGDEVQFGLSLNDPSTKTIYGQETDTGFPLYWSEGDKIQIASPQCVDGRQYAEYLVSPSTETTGQHYAVAMTKTGDYGVQWGNEEPADFYSIYPSKGTSWTALEPGNVVAKLHISSEQSSNLVQMQAADMKNVIMYATKTVNKRSEVVKLHYQPYSTILEFELGIAKNTTEGGATLPDWGTVKIVSMTLTAPDTTAAVIAGDFSMTFNGTSVPTIKATGNNSKSIKMDFETRPVLDEKNQTLKAKIAMIPLSGVKTLDGWKVTMEVLEGTDTETKTYSKTFSGSGNKTALAPGMVHKLKLPRFSQVAEWKPNTGKWIPELEDYKNIYLTELSLPGAWYAAAKTGEDGDNYQATESMKTLWNAGIRAFAVECKSTTGGRLNSTPSGISVSGTASKCWTNDGQYGGTTLRSVIDSVANVVTNEEFAVMVISYADGGYGRRDVDFEYFLEGVTKEINNSKFSNKIYKSSDISSNTTVYDVLGKLIIKINVDDNLPLGDYNKDANALLSYNPFVQQLPEDQIVDEDGNVTTEVDYTKIRYSQMYWKTWDDSYKAFVSSDSPNFLWCFASANRTQVDGGTVKGLPTYSQRKEALKSMIKQSKVISSKGTHNVWFYFNAGGAQATALTGDTDAQAFAKQMNSWLLDVIKLKANGGIDTYGVYGTPGAQVESQSSSLGIVMFNQCTGDNDTYHGKDIINEIIQMNNKFTLSRKNGTKARSAAPSYSSGMNDSDVAAFGWD